MKSNPEPRKLVYKFDGTEGAFMPNEKTAEDWRKKYEAHEIARGCGNRVIKAHFFGKKLIKKLLEPDHVMGIRIYHGLNDDEEKVLLLYAVDEDGNDLVQTISPEVNILDFGWRCPPYC